MKVRSAVIACGALLGSFLVVQNTSAVVTYETSSSMQFTFAPVLSLDLSADGFIINNLTPGVSDNSNEVTATVNTNNVAGYTLIATVGNETYNTTSLVYDTNSFAMMGSGTALTAGTWGYTLDDGITYGALDRTISTVLNKTVDTVGTAATGYLGTNATPIKVGAYAAENQPNGTYRNVINFAAVVNLTSSISIYEVSTMQAFSMMTASEKADVVTSMEEERVYVLKDSRDNKTYNIAKLKDGQVWMTSDLNLAGGTTLNAADSDVPTDNYFTLPTSSKSGFSSDSTAYVYNSGNETTNQADCTDSRPCNSYYSWTAATAGRKDASGNIVTGNGYNAAYSICPNGWRLPTATTSNAPANSNNNWKTGDFYKLATAYGADLESSHSQGSATFYNNAGPNTVPNFLLAGWNASTYIGTRGVYWSSSSCSSALAYILDFTSSSVGSAYDGYRRGGNLVRCVLK